MSDATITAVSMKRVAVDLAALGALSAMSEVSHFVAFHMHPDDLDTMLQTIPKAKGGAAMLGCIDLHVGHPVRRGVARIERDDGTFEAVCLRRRTIMEGGPA